MPIRTRKPPTAPETGKAAAPRAPRKKVAPKLPTAEKVEIVDPFAGSSPFDATEETPPVSEEKRTRKADPLLAAKRNLEKARANEAKAQKRVDAHGDIIAALEAAKAATAVAAEEFAAAVEAV